MIRVLLMIFLHRDTDTGNASDNCIMIVIMVVLLMMIIISTTSPS